MSAAIFDVDHTLLDGMSGYYFSVWLLRRGHMPLAGKLRTARSVFLYRTRLWPESEMVKVGVTCLARLDEKHVAELASRCVEEVIWPKVFSAAVEKIAEHNDAGDFTLLASGSAQPVIDALAKKIGAAGAVGTRARVGPEGAYLPVVEPPMCYRDGKTRLVERVLSDRGLRLEDAAVYSDNAQDIPLLEKTARPFAVNPDSVLKQVALNRGWPILTWDTFLSGDREATGASWPLRRA